MATPRVKKPDTALTPSTTVPSAEPAPPERPFRILAIDGGPAALLVTLLLTELEELVPGFLENVDLIAGTSAGAITGLMLATRKNPAYMLPVAENFWLNETNYYKNSIPGYLKALVGLGAINNSAYVGAFLAQRGVLSNRTLRELAKKVVLTSFDLNPVRRDPGMGAGPLLNWQPKIFQTLADDSGDMDVLATDAALSSSASPIVTPIHQGRVDGGLVSNNPAMIALSMVLHEARRTGDATLPREHNGIVMLSVGGGRAHEKLNVTNNSWGYVPWLLNLKNPLLLLNAFLSGDTDAVNFSAAEILNAANFRRLDPFYTEPGLLPFVQASPTKQQKTAESPGVKAMIHATALWLRECGWMQEPQAIPATASVAAGA